MKGSGKASLLYVALPAITTTINVYGHLMPESNKESGAKLDFQIFGDSLKDYKSSMNSSTESSAALKID